MKAIILVVVSLFQTSDIEDRISFERMKLVSYKEAYESTEEVLFVWVNYEDLQVYQHLTKQYPKAVHCFVKEITGLSSGGLVVGRKFQKELRRELDLPKAKPEEVILKIDQVLSKKTAVNHVETTVITQPVFNYLRSFT